MQPQRSAFVDHGCDRLARPLRNSPAALVKGTVSINSLDFIKNYLSLPALYQEVDATFRAHLGDINSQVVMAGSE